MSTKKSTQKQEIVNPAQEEDTIVIPVVDIFRQLKKYALLWIIIAVVAAGLIFGCTMAVSNSHATPLTAMVGFSYDGIEKGLDPNGNEFDANSIKSPSVIEQTLTELGMSANKVDSVRNGITVSGVVPSDTIDELTAYQSIFEATNSIEAAKRIMDVSYYPTRFEIQFTYLNTGMNRSQAADFLNTLLSNYKTYFMQTYGYNDAFGDALTAVDYSSYDYPQAMDVFYTTLGSLQSYVNRLATEDETRFRSTTTGYTFSDLNEAINTMRTVDYATLSSYVFGKNVTKDKDALQTYYQYRIDSLTRAKQSAEEKLASITDSITNYEKDSIVIVAGSDNSSNTPLTQPSEAYDDLIQQKTDAQSSVSSYQQQITDYTTRLENLQKKTLGNAKDKEKVEADMAALGEKINALIGAVNETADEYFETASYANSYSVLVPASGSVSNAVSNAISTMMRPLLVVEALLFVIYLVFAVVRAFVVSYRRNALKAAADAAEPEESDAAAEDEKTEKE
ncbi:MAG: lipopolysaccharide biosynthesis protein [Ruminococcus sp.]